MAAQPITTASTPVNPTAAEAALSSCGPAQMEACIAILRALATEAGDTSSFADRVSQFRKAFGFLAGAGHKLAVYGALDIPGDVEAHPDAVLVDAFIRMKSAWALCDLVAAPDWSEEQDQLGKLVDEAESSFFAIAPKSAEGMRMQVEQFILTNDDGSGTAGAFTQELRANALAHAERERAWRRPHAADPIHELFEQRGALDEKLHADLTAATNRAEEDAANTAFSNARERIEAEIVATPPQTRAGLIHALNVIRNELAADDGEQDYHAPLLGTLVETIERAPF